MNILATVLAVVIAYATSWTPGVPVPDNLTCINYSFGHVNKTFNGINVDNPAKLRKIVALKKQYPDLQVVLSIGGWGSGRFSEMVSDDKNRERFAKSCKRIIRRFKLDGVDIDWEYPTSSVAGISSAPTDTENYTKLMRDIRFAIGPDKILTQATVASCKYIDYAAVDQFVNYTNVMTYDMGDEHTLNAPLYQSQYVESLSADECMQLYVQAGVPREKLVMGIPSYGKGAKYFRKLWDRSTNTGPEGYVYTRDTLARVPIVLDQDGVLVFSYEDEQSIKDKAAYILEQGFLGAMYWSYESDTEDGFFRRTLNKALNPEN